MATSLADRRVDVGGAVDLNDKLRSGGGDGVVRIVGNTARKRTNARVTPEWEQGFARTKDGELAKTPGNVALVLLHDPEWAGVLGLDEMLQNIVWLKEPPTVPGLDAPRKGAPMAESDFIAVQQWLHLNREVSFSRETIEAGMVLAATHRQRRLLLALLERTLVDLTDSDAGVRSDALRWLRSDRPARGGFSFAYVADQLGLDVANVRGRLDDVAGRDLRRLAQQARLRSTGAEEPGPRSGRVACPWSV